jgi:hypothetical protein
MMTTVATVPVIATHIKAKTIRHLARARRFQSLLGQPEPLAGLGDFRRRELDGVTLGGWVREEGQKALGFVGRHWALPRLLKDPENRVSKLVGCEGMVVTLPSIQVGRRATARRWALLPRTDGSVSSIRATRNNAARR